MNDGEGVDPFPKVKSFQRAHFRRMTLDERKIAILETQAQLNHIACAATAAADDKRNELQQRIDYIRSLAK
jgi:hypothetical protein